MKFWIPLQSTSPTGKKFWDRLIVEREAGWIEEIHKEVSAGHDQWLKNLTNPDELRFQRQLKSGLRKCPGHKFATYDENGRCLKCGGYRKKEQRFIN